MASEPLQDYSPRPAVDRLLEASFSVKLRAIDTDTPVVVMHGEVDLAAAPELAEAVSDVLESFPRRLVFDLSKVTFMDSSGIKALVYARRGLPEGCPVVLRRPQPPVRRVLEITGLVDLFVFED